MRDARLRKVARTRGKHRSGGVVEGHIDRPAPAVDQIVAVGLKPFDQRIEQIQALRAERL